MHALYLLSQKGYGQHVTEPSKLSDQERMLKRLAAMHVHILLEASHVQIILDDYQAHRMC